MEARVAYKHHAHTQLTRQWSGDRPEVSLKTHRRQYKVCIENDVSALAIEPP